MNAQMQKVAGIEVWCLEDGSTTFDTKTFPDVSKDECRQRLEAMGQSEIETAFNAYLLRHPDGRLDLIDTGCGQHFGPNAGRLPSLLNDFGITAADISNIYMTHLHSDHAGGLVVDNTAAYPNARLFLHPDELETFKDNPDIAGLQDLYSTTMIADGDVLPGDLTVWGLPGHTPGHVGFWIGDEFAFVGDILHSYALQLPDMQLCSIYDMDPAIAIETRNAALTLLAQRGCVWTGSHAVGPKFMRAEADQNGFAIVSAQDGCPNL